MRRAHPGSIFADERGSMIIAAMAIIAITMLLVGTALTTATMRFRTAHQSSRWAQANQAAEAGVELALLAANADSWIAEGWSAAPGAVGAPPVTRTLTMGSGADEVSAAVSVDRVQMGTQPWLRIRSLGSSAIQGGTVAGVDPEDTRLRRLSLRFDRGTGHATATPRSTRQIEVLAGPRAVRPFKHMFTSKALFDIRALTVSDSYDSSDASKSDFSAFTTYGVYDVAKRQSNGNVATIDPLNDWNLNDAHIWGDVLMPTTSKNAFGTANVRGDVTKGFTFDFPDEVSPDWTTVTQNHGAVVNMSVAFSGGTQASPTRHKFSSLTLSSDNQSVRVSNPAGQAESWVEIWVEGDTFIDGKQQTGIKLDPGVHATIHFGGRVEIKGGGGGYALSNGSKLPANLIVRAYGGSSGAEKDFIVAYTDFWGVVSAPWYKVKFDLNGRHAHGSFLSWQFDASDGTNLHYDEALANLAIGGSSGFEVRSWIEAVR